MSLVAAAVQIIGAIWLALHVDTSFVGYWIMGAGSVLMLNIALRERHVEFFVMWSVFFVINVVGMIRWTPWI